MDVYEDNLLSVGKQGYRLAREKLLKIIGKTPEAVANGLTIQDMEPFFVRFHLQVRIFDACYTCIYEYDPQFRNPHIKVLYCLAKNSHIYTLNYNLKSLQHTRNDIDEDEEEDDEGRKWVVKNGGFRKMAKW